uniref:Uncharacterized protein n=1 Tax=Nelumbo nucifera TaxID=4432 RepID=A0A822YIX2_NELNU|nr:TPA_asm: hypothetical protein HUJ06_009717 [Nelumbo nucifera]
MERWETRSKTLFSVSISNKISNLGVTYAVDKK